MASRRRARREKKRLAGGEGAGFSAAPGAPSASAALGAPADGSAGSEWDSVAPAVAAKTTRRARRGRRRKDKTAPRDSPGSTPKSSSGGTDGTDGTDGPATNENGGSGHAAGAAGTVDDVLRSLDADLLAYVQGILADVEYDEDVSALSAAVEDAVGQVLVSSDFCESGAPLSAICTSLARAATNQPDRSPLPKP